MKPKSNIPQLRCDIPCLKFVCPKMKYKKGDDDKYYRNYYCDNPCTSPASGRMVYIYPEKNLRIYPRTLRGTKE